MFQFIHDYFHQNSQTNLIKFSQRSDVEFWCYTFSISDRGCSGREPWVDYPKIRLSSARPAFRALPVFLLGFRNISCLVDVKDACQWFIHYEYPGDSWELTLLKLVSRATNRWKAEGWFWVLSCVECSLSQVVSLLRTILAHAWTSPSLDFHTHLYINPNIREPFFEWQT